jgi:hypothetical protein
VITEKERVLRDAAISGDRNVIEKKTEKILKYTDLTTEIERMWNVRTKVTPVITGATGTVSRSFRKYLSNVSGKHEISNYRKQPYWALHTHTAGSSSVEEQNIYHRK